MILLEVYGHMKHRSYTISPKTEFYFQPKMHCLVLNKSYLLDLFIKRSYALETEERAQDLSHIFVLTYQGTIKETNKEQHPAHTGRNPLKSRGKGMGKRDRYIGFHSLSSVLL